MPRYPTVMNGELLPVFYWRGAIGEWNMDATVEKTVAFSTTNGMDDILSVEAWIRNDSDSVNRLVGRDQYSFYGSTLGCTITYQDSPQTIAVQRAAGGLYDTTDYNGTASTVANRGWVNVIYTVGQTRPT